MNIRYSAIFLASASIAALSIATPVAAQEAAQAQPSASSAVGLEEIVVTARRVQEKLQEVPVAVTAFTAKDIEEKQITNIGSLGQGIPNVWIQYAQFGSADSPTIQIRGVVGVSNEVRTDSPIGIYLDGVYMSRQLGLAMDMADLDQFEVLRGPQGTLFGKNTTGGAFNMTTKKPTGVLDGHLETSFGNYGMKRVKASFDLPEFDGFSIRGTVFHKGQDPDRSNPVGGTTFIYPSGPVTAIAGYDGLDENGGMLAVRYTGLDNLTVDFKADYSEDFNGQHAVQNLGFTSADDAFFKTIATGGLGPVGPYVLPLVGSGVAESSVGDYFATTTTENKAMGFNLTALYDFNDNLTLKNISAYRWQRNNTGNQDLGGAALTTPPTLAALGPILASHFPGDQFVSGAPLCFSLCSFYESQATHSISEELQLIGHEDRFDWIAGFFYLDEIAGLTDAVDIFGGSILPVTKVLPGGALGSPYKISGTPVSVDNQSWAFYGHATMHVTDTVDVSGGVRYSADRRFAQQYEQATFDAPLLPLAPANASFDNVDWDISLTWKFVPDANAYAKISTGYLSGGVLGGLPFDPINITSYEAGVKSEWFDHRARFNIDVWHTKQTDTQTQVLNTTAQQLAAEGLPPTTPLGAIVLSDPKVHVSNNGLEVEALAMPLKGLTLGANLGIVTDPVVIGITAGRPTRNVGLNAEYDFPPFANDMYFAIRADSTWMNGYVTGALPQAVIATSSPQLIQNMIRPATWILDLRGTLAEIPLGPVTGKISLWVKNLTDEQNLNYATDVGTNVAGTYDLPRTWGADFAFDF